MGVFLICIIWAFIYIKLNIDKKLLNETAKANLQNIVRSFKEHTESSIGMSDELLRIIKFNYERSSVVDFKTLNDYFSNGVLDMKYFNQIGVISKDGSYNFSNIKNQVKVNLADREHFQIHKNIYPYGLFISKPVLGRVSKKWSIQLTRRINEADGSFKGVAVVSFDPTYFLSFYKKIDLGTDGFIALVDKDGFVRTMQTKNMAVYNGSVPKIELTDAIKNNQQGFETTSALFDGVPRIYAYEQISDQPLMVIVGIKESDALAEYQSNKFTFLLFGWTLTGLIILFTTASLFMITRAKRLNQVLYRRNKEAEIANKEKIEFSNRLTQSEKLAALGQLSAGVAHEINNPIGYVSSNITTLKKYFEYIESVLKLYLTKEEQLEQLLPKPLPDTGANTPAANEEGQLNFADIHAIKKQINFDFITEDAHYLMSETLEGIVRVKDIINDLKNFARADSENLWEPLDLHKAIRSTLNIVSNEVKYKADVRLEFGDIPTVECIPSQINQVILNLIVNASQATKDNTRGLITLTTYVQDPSLPINEQCVVLEVKDQGSGIKAENLSKVFDPFFTTKKLGVGTGLGLSVSHGIIQRHQGEISVTSSLGEGTCFKIVLPVLAKTAIQ